MVLCLVLDSCCAHLNCNNTSEREVDFFVLTSQRIAKLVYAALAMLLVVAAAFAVIKPACHAV